MTPRSYTLIFYPFSPSKAWDFGSDTPEQVTFHGYVMNTSHSLLIPCLALGLNDM